MGMLAVISHSRNRSAPGSAGCRFGGKRCDDPACGRRPTRRALGPIAYYHQLLLWSEAGALQRRSPRDVAGRREMFSVLLIPHAAKFSMAGVKRVFASGSVVLPRV